MFLLALIALSVLALLPALCAPATGNKAAVRAADREGMPERAHTNHPAHRREARVTSDVSSPAASAAVSPDFAEGDDLETKTTTAAHALTHTLLLTVSPALSRGLERGVAMDRPGQDFLLFGMKESALALPFYALRPRPRVKPGDAGRRNKAPLIEPAPQ